MSRLKDKVVLITGASKGIGAGLAKGLAAEGAVVAVNYKNDRDGAEAVCRAISAAGGKALALQADVGVRAQMDALIATVGERLGPLDVLVNNAGRTRFGPAFEVTDEDFDDVVETNLRGPFFGSLAAARQMMEHGGGAIVNISSCAAALIMPGHAIYTPIKAALESLTRQLAVELAPKVRVNAISPGPTSTDRNRGYDPQYDKKWATAIPSQRVAQVEDYVGPCVFLASDDSKYLTGEILHVDGGWSLRGRTPDLADFDYSADRRRDSR